MGGEEGIGRRSGDDGYGGEVRWAGREADGEVGTGWCWRRRRLDTVPLMLPSRRRVAKDKIISGVILAV